MKKPCEHLHNLTPGDFPGSPSPRECEECRRLGRQWVELRECLRCGHVGCCDASPGKHASGHFRAMKHPVVRSAMPGETWTWCYVHQLNGELSEGRGGAAQSGAG